MSHHRPRRRWFSRQQHRLRRKSGVPFIGSSYVRRLRVEELEDRRMLAVLTVQNSLDDTLANLAGDGELSLREAIHLASHPGAVIDRFASFNFTDTIEFDPMVFDSWQTIHLVAQLPTITEPLTITGPGAQLLTIDAGGGLDGVLGSADGFRHFAIDDGVIHTMVDVELSGVRLTGGDVPEGGGAIFNREHLILQDSLLWENSASIGGGIDNRGDLEISGSTLAGNVASDAGGGIFNQRLFSDDGDVEIRDVGIIKITSSTLSGNSAINAGGGTFNSGFIFISSSTIAENSAAYGGGILNVGGMTLTSSIVANSASGEDLAGFGSLSGIHNLIGDGSKLSNFSASHQGDPRLGPLADYGGPTPAHALLPESPAIDAGSSILEVDQRGLARQVDVANLPNGTGDGSDIGAFELQAPVETFFLPANVSVLFETSSSVDLSASQLISLETGPLTLTLTVSDGVWQAPTASADVTATLVDPQTIRLVGTDPAINTYLDDPSQLQYTGALGVFGKAAATMNFTVDRDSQQVASGSLSIDVYEPRSLTVTTREDVVDPLDMLTSLRETIESANIMMGADTITFDPVLFSGSQTIMLDSQLPVITDALTVTATAPGLLTLDAGGGVDGVVGSGDGFRHFYIDDGSSSNIIDVALVGITLTGGDPQELNAGGNGGVIWNRENLTVESSTLAGNFAVASGGAIHNQRALSLIGSTISGNTAHENGGGIYNRYSNGLTVTNSTLSGNSATTGGGIYSHSSLSLSSSTVVGNSAERGGGIYSRSGTPSITSSIVASSPSGGDLAGLGTPTGSHNFVSDGSKLSHFTDSWQGNPQLGPLADNGGPTFTHALLPGSPAIDVGSSSQGTDQRGLTRPIDLLSLPNGPGNGSDIGAFELQIPAETYFFPTEVLAQQESLSSLDLSATQLVTLDEVLLTLTLTTSFGTFAAPSNDVGVTATLVDPQAIELVGTDLALNTYLDTPSNLQYSGATGTVGIGAASMDYSIEKDSSLVTDGTIAINIRELPSLVVTTSLDVDDSFDGVTSLREAIELANTTVGADVITFDSVLFAASQTMMLDSQLPTIIDALTIAGPGQGFLTIDAGSGTDGLVGSGDGFRHLLIDDGQSNDIEVTISGVTLTGGDPQELDEGGSGGAVWSRENLTVENSLIAENFAPNHGGGIYSIGTLAFVESTLVQNWAGENGGAIYSINDSSIIESTLSQNFADQNGGGIYNFGTMTVDRTLIEKSHGTNGAGIYNGSTLDVIDSTLSENIASQSGGGIYARSTTHRTSTLTGSTLWKNTASDRGGGIDSNSILHRVIITNSTLSLNSTINEGGGVYSRGNLSIDSSTVVENSAGQGGGIMAFGAVVTNTVVANSISGSDLALFDNVSGFHNLIGDGSELSDFTASIQGDPLLGPLADNGGPTWTHALMPGSSAINAGNSEIATDQRGATRPVDLASLPNGEGNSSDIGAFEVQEVADSFITSNLQVGFEVLSDFDLSTTHLVAGEGNLLTFTLTTNAGTFREPGDGEGVFATLVNPQTIQLVGDDLALNSYLNDPSQIQYAAPFGALGASIATVSFSVEQDVTPIANGTISVDILEQPLLVVTTVADEIQRLDGFTSLREAIELANVLPGENAITFDAVLFGTSQTIHLDSQLPTITDGLTISGPGQNLLALDAGGGVDGVVGNGDGFRHLLVDDGQLNDEIDVTLTGLTLTGGDPSADNLSGAGGAVWNRENLTLIDSMLSQNFALGSGGGIYNAGTAAIVSSTMADNAASVNGGAISNTGSSSIAESTFVQNMAGEQGGAIFNDSQRSLSVARSTLSNNSSIEEGGGIYNAGSMNLNSGTLFENSGEYAGGIFNSQDAIITNSIVAGSTVGDDLAGVATFAGGYNLIGDGSHLSNFAHSIQGEPLLAPLADNGGPTMTHALLPGSPVIDAGDALPGTDQRGLTRPVDLIILPNGTGNGTDIGAVELQAPSETLFLPESVQVVLDTLSPVDLSATQFFTFDASLLTLTLTVDGGLFAAPDDGNGVTATLVDQQTIELVGTDVAINTYLDQPAHIQYAGAAGALGQAAATMSYSLARNATVVATEVIQIDVLELASFVVTTTSDAVDPFDGSTSLREAILLANATGGADTISFDTELFGTSRTILLDSQLPIVIDPLTITGPGQELLSLDADGGADGVVGNGDGFRHFEIDDSDRDHEIEVVLSGITFLGGDTYHSGGAIWNSEDLTLDSVTITGNHASNRGGGIYNGHTLALLDSTLSGNISYQDAGAIFSSYLATITDSTISGNTALRNGGGIYNRFRATITGSTISGNTAQRNYYSSSRYGYGGGIFSSDELNISDSTVSDNSANHGGGIYIAFDHGSFPTSMVTNSNISNNLANEGGGIFNNDDVTIIGSNVSDNWAIFGGGIYNDRTANVIESNISGNTASRSIPGNFPPEHGGGIFNRDMLTVSSSTLSNNFASGSGGGIFNYSNATITSSTLYGNSATDAGGGIFNDGRATIESSTLSGNSAGGYGGGIHSDFDTTLSYSTLSGNFASGSGGGIYVESGAATIYGSIVANSASGGDLAGGGTLDGGFNLIGDGSRIDEFGNNSLVIQGDPRLGPLADNGGPTQTHALLQGSPAFNSGGSGFSLFPNPFDQRGDGFGRMQFGQIDIGAFEVQPMLPIQGLVVSTAEDIVDDNFSRGELSLREAIYFANSVSGSDTISFDPLQFGTPQTIALVRQPATFDAELPTITDSLTLVGPGSDLLTIDAGGFANRTRVFFVNDGDADSEIDVVLSGLTLTGGRPHFNDHSGDGGAIWNSENLTITNSSIKGNIADDGGGVFNDGTLTVSNSIVEDNRADEGGGIFSVGSSGTAIITSSTLFGNVATRSGGGIFNGGSTAIIGTTISNNTASTGGGIYNIQSFVSENNIVTITSSTLTDNSADSGGGITNTRFGLVTVSSSILTGNTSGSDGGAIRNFGTVTVFGSSLLENSARYGGAIWNSEELTVTSSTLADNSAIDFGGGIFNDESATISSSTLSSNTAERDGGGIFNEGTLTVKSSTLSENSTEDRGGGIYNVGIANIEDSTLSGNSAEQGGGIFINSNSSTLSNSIVANSTSGGDLDGFTSSILDGSFNLIADGSLLFAFTDSVQGDPLLGPLSDNGGPTLTHALLPGSPAIDAGQSGATSDQRGLWRAVDLLSIPNGSGNATDIGAFEIQMPLETFFFPTDLSVGFEASSDVDLSATQLVTLDESPLALTLNVSTGAFATPNVSEGVTATLIDPQTIELVGTDLAINTYLDNPSNIQYTGATGAHGEDVATVNYSVEKGATQLAAGSIDIDIFEPRSLVVTTAADVVDPLDLMTSLREAIDFANLMPGNATITFDLVLSGQSVLLTEGELEIFEAFTIDALALPEGITIDAQGQSRVFNADVPFATNETFDVTLAGLTLTGGSSAAILFRSSGMLTLDQSFVSGNSSGISSSSGNVTLLGSTVTENSSRGISASSGDVTLENSLVNENSSNGISTTTGAITLINSIVSDNSTAGVFDEGGGIFTRSGNVTLNHSTVSGNSTAGTSAEGGGIYTRSGDVTLNHSTVSGNSTAGTSAEGGGIYTRSGEVIVNHSTVSGNSTTGSDASGGGIYTLSGSLTLNHGTVSGNSTLGVTAEGGGIHTSSGAVMLSSSTVADNHSGADGGGVWSTSGDVSLENSLVAANTAVGSAADLRISEGAVVNVSYSLIGDARNGLSTALRQGTGNMFDIAPLLGPLSDNGGPTLTHTLLPGSPAIDAGNSDSTSDQRGLSRVVDLLSIPNSSGNASDIGALELQIPSEIFWFPTTELRVEFEASSDVDLSATQLVTLDESLLTLVLVASDGAFATPSNGEGVTATLVNPQTVVLVGLDRAINAYLDNPSNIQYTGAADALGEDIATVSYFVEKDATQVATGAFQVDIFEPRSLVVTTAADVIDPLDLMTSLREAIDFANLMPGSATITFDSTLSGQSALLTEGELEIFDALTIDAMALLEGITIDAQGQSRVFNADVPFTANETFDVTLAGMTVTGGDGAAIQFRSSGMLTLDQMFVSGSSMGISSSGDVTLLDSSVSGNMGNGISTSSGSVTLVSSTVSGNSRTGISITSDAVTISDSEITENTAGGIKTTSGNVTLNNSAVLGNSASTDGGGIKTSSGTVILNESTVSGNSTSGTFSHGGGIATTSGDITINHSTVSENSSLRTGGGIYSVSGKVTVIGSTVSQSSGTGISTSSGDISLSDSTLFGNTSVGIDASNGDVVLVNSTVTGNNGVGLDTFSGDVTIMGSTVSGNTGSGINTWGGDILLAGSNISGNTGRGINTRSGYVLLTDSLVSENTRGGIYTTLSDVTINNSTVSGNSILGSGAVGSGIHTANGDVIINNSTVSGNSVLGESGSGIYARGPTLWISNSIVAGNTAGGSAADLRVSSDIQLSIGYSLIGDTTSGLTETQLQEINNGIGNILNVDPLLAPLADNGGSMPTHALMPGSPAIDSGDPNFASPPFYDQRGFNFTRFVGGRVDMGAVESGATSADFDFDGDVDGNDFLRWQRGMGSAATVHSDGDANVDGNVDTDDLDIWSQTYRDTPIASADFDLDGDIDGGDFLMWQRGFGAVVANHSDGDADYSGIVDSNDLAIWSATYLDAPDTSADFDLDGDWDGTEFLMWQRGFGTLLALYADVDVNLDNHDLAVRSAEYWEAVVLLGISPVDDTTLIDTALIDAVMAMNWLQSAPGVKPNLLNKPVFINEDALPQPIIADRLTSKSGETEVSLLTDEYSTKNEFVEPWLTAELLDQVFGNDFDDIH